MDAINAANENDTIYVYSGIYNENLVIGKSIKLKRVDSDPFTGFVVGSPCDKINVEHG